MNKFYDCIIIGGGVAGLTSALYLLRAGNSVLIIDESGGGNLLEATELKNFPGFLGNEDGNMGASLINNLLSQVESYGGVIIYDKAINPKYIFPTYSVECSDDIYYTKSMIIATGTKHRELECNITNSNIHYCALCDGVLYNNKDVIIIGGGDSAITSAIYLARGGCNSVKVIHRREFNTTKSNYIEAVKLGVEFILNIGIEEISNNIIYGRNKVNGSQVTFHSDGIFICIGQVPNSEFAKSLGIEVGDDFSYRLDYIKVGINGDYIHSTNKPGIFACGSITGYKYDQAIIAAGDAAYCALEVNDYLLKNLS